MTEIDSFTEAAYLRIIKKAAMKYRFNGSDLGGDDPVVCWRHDIDYSPHRALSLAQYEAQLGLRCVYHILPSGRYYNVLEPEIAEILQRIAGLGHEIGLHFDMDVLPPGRLDQQSFLERVKFEQGVVEMAAGCELISFSFHNHTLHLGHIVEEATIAGLRNLASPAFYDQAKYISDSNGIWRGESLEQIVDAPPYPKLHVLTHPVWWTPDGMTPYERFLRAVEGRAKANKKLYLATMRRDGRLGSIGSRIGIRSEDIIEIGGESEVGKKS